eukprot:6189019-Pleurochrysis_carterae.AAC.1
MAAMAMVAPASAARLKRGGSVGRVAGVCTVAAAALKRHFSSTSVSLHAVLADSDARGEPFRPAVSNCQAAAAGDSVNFACDHDGTGRLPTHDAFSLHFPHVTRLHTRLDASTHGQWPTPSDSLLAHSFPTAILAIAPSTRIRLKPWMCPYMAPFPSLLPRSSRPPHVSRVVSFFDTLPRAHGPPGRVAPCANPGVRV